MSLTKTSYSMITGAPANVLDYGATTSDTVGATNAVAINAALVANKEVVVPEGIFKINSTVNVPAHTKLMFAGGSGNTVNSYPASYLLKAAAMTTPAITIQSTGCVDGGGVVCEVGNAGDGVQLVGNSARVTNHLVHGAGNDGIRVGVNANGNNSNSCKVLYCVTQYNIRHGLYVHDGTTEIPANANVCAVTSHFSQNNGGDGIKLGRAWWASLSDCLTEGNTGYGLNLSSAITNGDTVAECRYANVFGGDFNEGNTVGSLNLASYASCVYMASANQVIINTGVLSNVYGSVGEPVTSLISTNNVTAGYFNTANGDVAVTAAVQSGNLYTVSRGATIFDINSFGTGASLQTTALITSDGTNITLTLLKSGASSVLAIVGSAVRVTCANTVTLSWTANRISA